MCCSGHKLFHRAGQDTWVLWWDSEKLRSKIHGSCDGILKKIRSKIHGSCDEILKNTQQDTWAFCRYNSFHHINHGSNAEIKLGHGRKPGFNLAHMTASGFQLQCVCVSHESQVVWWKCKKITHCRYNSFDHIQHGSYDDSELENSRRPGFHVVHMMEMEQSAEDCDTCLMGRLRNIWQSYALLW